jgi:hypothetical protein
MLHTSALYISPSDCMMSVGEVVVECRYSHYCLQLNIDITTSNGVVSAVLQSANVRKSSCVVPYHLHFHCSGFLVLLRVALQATATLSQSNVARTFCAITHIGGVAAPAGLMPSSRRARVRIHRSSSQRPPPVGKCDSERLQAASLSQCLSYSTLVCC